MLWIWIILWCSNIIFGFDLWDEIYNTFKSLYDKWVSVEYLESAYKSEYPEDPFMDAFNNLDGMQKQVKVAWAQYIEDELRANNCGLSKKEIWWILYYFVPEFRAEIASGLKKEGWHKDSKKLSFNDDKIEKYCEKYYFCVQTANGEYDQMALWIRKYRITASTPKDIMTNCKEYFQNAYAKWSENEKRMQAVKSAWVWNDKFWNATTDDSPYDIMLDLNSIGVFMFEDSAEPITPVFYNLPVFSNSAQSLLNNMNNNWGWWNVWSSTLPRWERPWWNAGNYAWMSGWYVWTGAWSTAWWNAGNFTLPRWGRPWWNIGSYVWMSEWSTVWWVSLWAVGVQSMWSSEVWDNAQILGREELSLWDGNNWLNEWRNEPVDRPEESKWESVWVVESLDWLWLSSESISDVYDDLVDWLWATSVVDKWTFFYGSLCKDNEIDAEPESNIEKPSEWRIIIETPDWWEQALSEEEYQEMVNYMMGAVDQYSALPAEVQAEILEFVASLDIVNPEWWYNAPATPDTSDEAVSQIKSCVQSCNGLRADQYLTCVEMCACGERTSKIFDPEWNSWLWPIAKIKFCTVPGVDMKFSEWGRNIISIEEWGKEILWVVDKLSREWKLWIWTKQSNFLDSSTKKMNMGKSVSFSIGVEGVDVWEKAREASKQYEENILKIENEFFQSLYNISNSLNDSSRKNKFRMVWYEWENINDYKWQIDADKFRKVEDDMENSAELLAGKIEELQSDRYVSTSEDLNTFLDRQASYWKAMQEYVNNVEQYAKALYAKKK